MKISFDIDGTLISNDKPRYHVIDLMRWFIDEGHEVFVWSGGGTDYALHWVQKLGLDIAVKVITKGSVKVDIAVDDEEVTLGKVNIKV